MSMTSLPTSFIPISNTSLPVAIDYPAALALRQ
ncbi:phage integrase family protein, partial [Serratia marcescens]